MPAFIQASGDPIAGIQIGIKRDQPSDIVGGSIQRAFQKVGFDAQAVVRTDDNYEDDGAVILVGIKP